MGSASASCSAGSNSIDLKAPWLFPSVSLEQETTPVSAWGAIKIGADRPPGSYPPSPRFTTFGMAKTPALSLRTAIAWPSRLASARIFLPLRLDQGTRPAMPPSPCHQSDPSCQGSERVRTVGTICSHHRGNLHQCCVHAFHVHQKSAGISAGCRHHPRGTRCRGMHTRCEAERFVTASGSAEGGCVYSSDNDRLSASTR